MMSGRLVVLLLLAVCEAISGENHLRGDFYFNLTDKFTPQLIELNYWKIFDNRAAQSMGRSIVLSAALS